MVVIEKMNQIGAFKFLTRKKNDICKNVGKGCVSVFVCYWIGGQFFTLFELIKLLTLALSGQEIWWS